MASARKTSSGEMVLKGIGVSPGIAVAPVFLLAADDRLVPERRLTDREALAEIMRLENAIIETRRQLTDIHRHVEEQAGRQHADIFDMHKLVLDDPAFIAEVFDGILKRHANAEHAIRLAAEGYTDTLSRVEDDYLRERVSDVKDVARRLIRNLSDSTHTPLTGLSVRSVIVGVDLAPSETATLQREWVLGFATDQGSPTSHTAIMARALGIPAVVGLSNISQLVKVGEEILVDGSSGEVVLRPSTERRRMAGLYAEEQRTIQTELGTLRDQPAETADGHAIVLSANVELVSELPAVLQSGAQGIGLFRSEYLYISRETLPSEEEQLAAYGEAAKAMAPQPVIIRTVDLGGDKFASSVRVPHEVNPFLGFRAIRFCLAQPALFKTQVRAILRASALGRVSMMYPMISNVGEVRQANAIVDACKEELRGEGLDFDEKMPVGAMVEIPSAALTAEIIAPHVKFFSLGTNDLVQYTLAVDRVNERVAHLYEPTHPAVLRLIRCTIEAGHAHGVWVGVCGEMAGNPVLTPLLVGMGLDELSTVPANVPAVKDAIRRVRLSDAQALAENAAKLGTAAEILDLCRELTKRTAPEILRLAGKPGAERGSATPGK